MGESGRWLGDLDPKGPKIENIQDRPPGSRLKISSEPPSKPLFLCGGGRDSESRLKFSIGLEIFNRD